MPSPSLLVDLVKIAVLSSGTGAFRLGPAINGYRGTEALIDGGVYSYSVQLDSQYEVGRGTWLAEMGQLARAPFFSSNGNASVDFGPNTAVALTFLAEDIMAAVAPPSSETDALVREVSRATAAEALLAQSVARVASGLRSYATLATLNADASQPDGTLAYVYNDPTATNDTIYSSTGGIWSVASGFYAGLASVVQPLVTAAQAAQHAAEAAAASIATTVTASAHASTDAAVDRRFNLCSAGKSRTGYIDNGAGDMVAATDWRSFIIATTPGGTLTLSHHLSASTGYYFTDGAGTRIGGNTNGITIGDGPGGNLLTYVAGGFQLAVPADAAFLHLSVPAIYVGPVTDTNLAFLPRFVVLDGTVALGSAGLYDPASTRGQQRWAGRRLFVQADSFWHQREWPLDLAASLGLASMVRAFRGGRQMSQGLTRTVDSIANMTNATDTGATDVGIVAADVAGIDAFVLALHTNDAAAGVPIGTYTDAPATFDANGAMTGGGATYFSRARGVIETLVGWNPRMMMVLGTPIYRPGVPLIADYQVAIETLADMYGAALCRPDRKLGVNSITAESRLADGVHLSDADFTALYQTCWRDFFEAVSPLN